MTDPPAICMTQQGAGSDTRLHALLTKAHAGAYRCRDMFFEHKTEDSLGIDALSIWIPALASEARVSERLNCPEMPDIGDQPLPFVVCERVQTRP